ncbi:DUF938 domain-containing protein [Undibacterium cyanobacteriorum]|uniref:DUF938 domain-containing protein n=1 Tax=Undibacterium cyanobacteriorum TaxID=3073561 RepID=A0ABY9RM54_9BURK|nr:DUF938 domain-containing protein [Undibacterium sp. 20NA77.5]WMW81355.1 DUF938 domain-containing protein [Undibacterium sp. 20NA77.5]
MNEKKYSPACERNRAPILEKLKHYFDTVQEVLEIGSGTGQHAVFFAQHLPHIHWYTSDRDENHSSIQAWIEETELPRIHSPYSLDVKSAWPERLFDAAFTANTCHIMAWDEVICMFNGLSRHINTDGLLVIYGPFNYLGQYTSPSNEAFDHSLQNQAPHMGLRDFEKIKDLGAHCGFELVADHDMPANNRLLVFKKTTNTSALNKSV